MKLVTHTTALTAKISIEEAVKMIAEAGFDAVDCSFFDLAGEDSVWLRENWRERAENLRALARSLGVTFQQAHAPFPVTKGDGSHDGERYGRILRSMEIASILGVENIVVHPVHYPGYCRLREEQYRASVEFYKGLIPYCQQFGIRVCAENMWIRDPARIIREGILARPEEFIRILEEIDSPFIGGCLDIGHVALVGQDPADMIRRMGKRITCLHVHDVDYHSDCHTMPFMENLDWDSITDALRDIGYQGAFTFETENFINKLPQPLWADGLKMMERVGRYLISRIEA